MCGYCPTCDVTYAAYYRCVRDDPNKRVFFKGCCGRPEFEVDTEGWSDQDIQALRVLIAEQE